MSNNIQVLVADELHVKFAEKICAQIEKSAQERGTGIARRTPEYVAQKMREGKAVVALVENERGIDIAGFCYIETWGHNKFVANSGLIVFPEYRKHGMARAIKKAAFELSKQKYPEAKMFGLTTSLAVMTINAELGYRPVTYSELTDDEQFWKGCQSCVNFEILQKKQRKNCMCTAMLYDGTRKSKPETSV
jgi:hypothetical protein